MNIIENIFTALSGITGNKMRSILTMFGIVVGISSVIMITSIGEGFKVSMNSEFEALGLDRLTIQTRYEDTVTIEDGDVLRYEDVRTLRKYNELIEVSAGYSAGTYDSLTMLNGDLSTGILYGVDDAYYRMNTTKVKHGRLIVEADMDNVALVAVISENLAMDAFGKTNVIGEILQYNLWGTVLELSVIGVTESDAGSAFSSGYSRYQEVYVPITLVQSVFSLGDGVASITVKVTDTDRITPISENIKRIMELNHDNEGKYVISSIADNMQQVDSVIGIFTLFLGIVAGISLLVGGIGVMNIMLVSVTERTREIGIRKSLGATNFNIQLQFLTEAVILTAIGGTIGILFGYLGGFLFGYAAVILTGMAVTPFISVNVVVFVVGISAGIGILFGVYPAAKAARLDPIEALRFE